MTNSRQKRTLLPERGFIANCSQPPFANITFSAALFSPPALTPQSVSRLSLWREYEVLYDALTYLLLETFHADAVFSSLEKLSAACAASKRKRSLTLYAFSFPNIAPKLA